MGTYDFDQARAERHAKRKPPTLLAFGETIDLPFSVPVATALVVNRDPDRKLDLELYLELLGILVGDETVERWLAEHPDIGAEDIGDLYYGALSAIREGDPDPEAPAPKTGASRAGRKSSSTGARSKRTSAASTRSTSAKRSGAG